MICRICHEPCNGRRHTTIPLGTVHGIRPHFAQVAKQATRMTEQWRAVPGWEGYYEVSDQGRVRSLDRVITTKSGVKQRLKGRVLKAKRSLRAHSHWHVDISRGDTHRTARVHALVLEAFVGPRPAGMECCHNDGDRDNNTLQNLRWDTKSSNEFDRVRHGTHQNAIKTHCPRNHPYDAENTVRWASEGRRRCRTCERDRSRRKRQRQREARQLQQQLTEKRAS